MTSQRNSRYMWTQWIFLKLHNSYFKSEVGGFPVIRKPMRQWILRILGRVWRLFVDEQSETEFEPAGTGLILGNK